MSQPPPLSGSPIGPPARAGAIAAARARGAALADALRSLPRAAWILFLGVFLNKFGTFVMPFLSLYLTRQGFTLGQAAVAIAAYGGGQLIASALGGHLADTMGRRKTIVLSMFLAAVCMLALSQARSYWTIVLLTGLTGLAAELYRPASSALLTDLVPAGQRVTAFSAYRLAFNAGWAFGPAVGGFLADHSYFWLFVGDAVTSILFGLVAWFALPQGVRSERAQSGWGEAWRTVRLDRTFQRLLLASLAVSLIFPQMGSTFGLQVTGLGFSAATYGLLISLNGVLVVLLELPLTTITQRLPARPTMAVGYALLGLGFALPAFLHTIPGLLLAVVVFTFGEMISIPVAAAAVADLAPVHMRGRYMGVLGLTGALGHMGAPLLGMNLFAWHPPALWWGCGLVGLFAAWVSVARHRQPPG